MPTRGWSLAQAPDRAAEGPREQGVSVGTQGRWAKGFTLYNTNPQTKLRGV